MRSLIYKIRQEQFPELFLTGALVINICAQFSDWVVLDILLLGGEELESEVSGFDFTKAK